MKSLQLFFKIVLILFALSCTKIAPSPTDTDKSLLSDNPGINKRSSAKPVSAAALGVTVTENFETGTKTAYTAADVTLISGTWNLNDALIGNSASDRKNGLQSARVRNSGKLTMKFDNADGAADVTLLHALYGTDAASTWQLWYSTNAGVSYLQAGATVTTSSTTLSSITFTLNIAGNIRFEIRKTDGTTSRICFDDIVISPYNSTSTVPTLSAVSPASVMAGSSDVLITATGTNFTSASTIDWNGTVLATTFVNTTSLTTSIPAANLTTAGTYTITVTTAGNGTSAAIAFTVQSIPAPVLGNISPNNATAGAAAFTLTATGSNFLNTSVINWNGMALTTTYVNATTLTTTIPAANLAAAGTAGVTVSTPGAATSSAITFTINAVTTGPKKFLFDASQGETAGNADWVIDEDNSTPQRIPTPLQSNVTATTSETYWTGAISSWGIALAKQGHTVETLPSSGSITYGNTANAQDLSKYDVFVIDEPNIRFTTAEKTAILNFVQNGGGLFMIADHTISDRNNDGWDSPAIWNDLMTNNGTVTNPFGFSVDLTNFSQVSSNVLTGNSTNKILHGSQGNVTQMEFNNGASLTLSPASNATVQGLIWKSGLAQNNSNVMCASSTYGTGRVYCVTDSSPMDDGTGAPNNTLFVSWSLYSHKALFMNASLWLAKLQ